MIACLRVSCFTFTIGVSLRVSTIVIFVLGKIELEQTKAMAESHFMCRRNYHLL